MCFMILLKFVNIFEIWIQEFITKLLDTPSQSSTVKNEVVFSKITTKIITEDDKNQDICFLLLLVH